MEEMEDQKILILRSSSLFPIPEGVKFSYGTAGFRTDGSILSSTAFRMGILAALRSLKTRSAIGLMITASHNVVTDNGVKIADFHGGMLTQEWEPFADEIANTGDASRLHELIIDFVKKEKIPFGEFHSGEVMLGRDTRPTGEALVEAARQGIYAVVGVTACDMGVVTTPQLHWMVRSKNRGLEASEFGYFQQLANSFRILNSLMPKTQAVGVVPEKLLVDAANGVGGIKLKELVKSLDDFKFVVRNSGEKGEGVLNEGVGADYVQKEKVPPHGFGINDIGARCLSLDGDADRIVYFRILSTGGICLVDGDKILSLFALFINDQLSILNENEENNCSVKLGVVQTAYANGASTKFLRQFGVEIALTKTGVKYLHEKAAEYDIGIYFEANGHGTILFGEEFLSWLELRRNELSSSNAGSEQQNAAERLLAVSKLINQAVGDAISVFLLVELVLKYMRWSIEKWSLLYQDFPSRQLKVKVKDRTAVVTENAETCVLKPAGLQEAINFEVAKYPQGRSFVRPSGTEDVVRIYAEASNQDGADCLAQSVAELVKKFLGS